MNDVPEDRDSIRSAEAYGCAGEAQALRIWQRLVQEPGVAVEEAILGAVRFVRNDDDVIGCRQHRMAGLAPLFLQPELLDGGEHHLAAAVPQQLTQVIHGCRVMYWTNQGFDQYELV